MSLFHLTTFKVRISLCREYVIRRQFLQRLILHCSHYSESRIYPRRRRNWRAYPRRRRYLVGKFSGDLAIRGCCTAANTENLQQFDANVSTCPALLHLTRVASLTSLARPALPALRCQPCAASQTCAASTSPACCAASKACGAMWSFSKASPSGLRTSIRSHQPPPPPSCRRELPADIPVHACSLSSRCRPVLRPSRPAGRARRRQTRPSRA